MKKIVLSIVLSGLWITFSEFLRNEFLLKEYWVNQFNSLGLTFETLPINGILWMVWSFTLAFLLFKFLQKFSMKETILLGWLPSFFMMWIVVFNLQTLPLNIVFFVFAIPLSIIEILAAIIIIKKILHEKIEF